MITFGREFLKLSGSGNDFVFIDSRSQAAGPLASPEVVQAICRKGTGIGADGVVFIEPSSQADVKMTYLNADGSRADLCGNATLCTARVARELGIVAAPGGGSRGTTDFAIETDVGALKARFRGDVPEIDLQPVTQIRPDAGIPIAPGEQRMGFALAGVPHLVILVDDLEGVDVVGRGRPLRRHPSLSAGANVNFVRPRPDGAFAVRTYERGVEAETLACGTGAVATAVLLTEWGLASGPIRILTRSGRELGVRLSGSGDRRVPSLSGEARIVFRGQLGEVDSAPKPGGVGTAASAKPAGSTT